MPARLLPLERVPVGAGDAGLAAAEVAVRRKRYGGNDIVAVRRHPWRALAADTVRDPMLWFLVATSGLYAAIGDTAEAVTLAAAVVPLAGMDAYLHRRTAASTEGLRSRLAARARVVRDGSEQTIPAADVVPGDVALVAAGELVPADGVIVAGADVQVDESTLTGESVPVRKRPTPLPSAGAAVPVAEEHWLIAGTRVLAGSSRVVVVYTGADTLYGEIVRAAAESPVARTALQRAIAALVGVLTAVAVGMCLLLAAVRWAQGHGLLDAVVSALTLAVAALPEELPVVFTFFLGVGVYRLARRHALVRRAAAVENVGRLTTICTDKTGTVTEGRLVLAHLVPASALTDAALVTLANHAARPENGDPLDVALASVAGPLAAAPVATFPFTEDRKRETAVVRRDGGALVAVTKGALETVLARAELDAADRADWIRRADDLARGGHKVIACASCPLGPEWDGREPEAGLVFAGLLAFEDPVRPGVAEAIAECRAAGLRVIMVTGDHPLTATAIAREIGLGEARPVVAAGDEIAAALAAGAFDASAPLDVVARATPTQKLRLVEALQRAGEVVAVTGDGVNDVPALTTADVGIAMGERGTQSAREAAPIVLLDDDFGTIVGAIAEGRQLFQNLRRSVRYLLMIHVPLVVTAALIPLSGHALLYLPIHIVWIELVMHPTALLAFQGSASNATLAPAADEGPVRLLRPAEWLGVALVGVTLTMLVAGGFLGALEEGSDVGHARGVALLTLSFASAAVAAAVSGLRTRAASLAVAGTVAGALLLVQLPAVAARFHVTPLHGNDIGGAVLGALVIGALAALCERYAQRAEAVA